MRKFKQAKIIRITLTLIFLLCAVYANFYAVRKMMRYGVELYFYDKLLVAYNIGARSGLENELNQIISSEKVHRVVNMAREFQSKLPYLQDPQGCLRDVVENTKNRLLFIRNLRLVAILFIFLIFGWRLLVNLKERARKKKA